MQNSHFSKLTLRLAFGNVLSYTKSTLVPKQRQILTAGISVCLSMQLGGFSVVTMSRHDLKDIIFPTDDMDEDLLYGRREPSSMQLCCSVLLILWGQGKKRGQGHFLVEMQHLCLALEFRSGVEVLKTLQRLNKRVSVVSNIFIKSPAKTAWTLRAAGKKWKQLFSPCLQSIFYKGEHLYYQKCVWTLFFYVSYYYCRDFCITEEFF